MKIGDYIADLLAKIETHGLLYPKGSLTKLELCERIHFNVQNDFSNTFWSLLRIWYYNGNEVPSQVVSKIASEEHNGSFDEVKKLLSGNVKTLQRKLKN